MQLRLSQRQRVLVALSYFVILVGLFRIVGGTFGSLTTGAPSDSNIWFYSGAFMIILGVYLLEPYFTTPSNAVANSTVILIALLSLTSKHQFFGYRYIFSFSLTVLFIGIAAIILKDATRPFARKIGNVGYWYVKTFGSAKVIFSVVYIAASYSYFAPQKKSLAFLAIFVFWILLTFYDVVGLVILKFSELRSSLGRNLNSQLGQAIGCQNRMLFRVEVARKKQLYAPIKKGDLVALEMQPGEGAIAIVVEMKVLLNKSWLSIYLMQKDDGSLLSVDLVQIRAINDKNSIFNKENLVYSVDFGSIEDENLKSEITNNPFYQGREQFIGYVAEGSNINTVNILLFGGEKEVSSKLGEGSVLTTHIRGEETLYQLINGITRQEHLENFDEYGFTVGVARKLGRYCPSTKSLDVSKWMPPMFSPVFYAGVREVSPERLREIGKSSVGRLPETDLEIPVKDLNALVTHNTAILGILGIGKSFLAYELIMRVVAERVKVVCIDITNEYAKELPIYLPGEQISRDDENVFNQINSKRDFVFVSPNGAEEPEKSGNVAEYRQAMRQDLCRFLFGVDHVPESKEFELTKSIRIYNVDYHQVNKGEKIGYKVITTPLTQAEKTRILVEILFMILMEIPLEDEKRAKVLLVFEEAHSLIPEWNSTANDGDKNATNGTSKYLLQGRKYGLGSLVVTQRTANVSKSILNQCNTIFALRVFDDTGKTFLENYIGKDYADTLATLEERHAIAVGKGLQLKQPVILQLNDRENVLSNAEPNATVESN